MINVSMNNLKPFGNIKKMVGNTIETRIKYLSKI